MTGKIPDRSEAVSVRVPRTIVRAMDDLIEKEIYGSRADFVKCACRFYLRELGYLVPREVKGPGKLPTKIRIYNECKTCDVLKKCEICNYIK
ncbi:MAG: ribbon-helix-helix domain-containing protein [Candidatus Thermoplasmatota archaeon]|nr:ribbon-helix-helix domain-containing protein [Candidatus Thermoplasmatota archaeon]